MRAQLVWGTSAAGIALLAFWVFNRQLSDPKEIFEPTVRHLEAAPLCPWRQPEMDQRRFFPSATHHHPETRVLSAYRVELRELLGRPPEPEENALVRHRITAGGESVGFVLTRRVKGEHEAIELVVAIDPSGAVEGVSLQRLREPEAIAKELQNEAWLGLFRGRTHECGWDTDDLRHLPEAARVSGQAIREGVRSLLILQAPAEGRITG